jgi:hypothetical protein
MQSDNRMVTVGGKTYRFCKGADGKYEVFRILDDRRVGTFQRIPNLCVEPDNHSVSINLLREIALTALQQGRLSWTGRLQVA